MYRERNLVTLETQCTVFVSDGGLSSEAHRLTGSRYAVAAPVGHKQRPPTNGRHEHTERKSGLDETIETRTSAGVWEGGWKSIYLLLATNRQWYVTSVSGYMRETNALVTKRWNRSDEWTDEQTDRQTEGTIDMDTCGCPRSRCKKEGPSVWFEEWRMYVRVGVTENACDSPNRFLLVVLSVFIMEMGHELDY